MNEANKQYVSRQYASVFDQYADVYDQSRRRLIPCFDDFYSSAINLLPYDREAKISVLDLGAGTGLLAAFILARHPHARLTLIDTSAEMLEQARQRFQHLEDQVVYHQGDYSQNLPDGPFESVVSALSIHHLEKSEKLALFDKLPGILVPAGIFINADQVLGETPEEDECFRSAWLAAVRTNGVSKAELAAAHERMKADRMSTLSVQLTGLQNAGFSRVSCVFQEDSFVVYAGCKENVQS